MYIIWTNQCLESALHITTSTVSIRNLVLKKTDLSNLITIWKNAMTIRLHIYSKKVVGSSLWHTHSKEISKDFVIFKQPWQPVNDRHQRRTLTVSMKQHLGYEGALTECWWIYISTRSMNKVPLVRTPSTAWKIETCKLATLLTLHHHANRKGGEIGRLRQWCHVQNKAHIASTRHFSNFGPSPAMLARMVCQSDLSIIVRDFRVEKSLQKINWNIDETGKWIALDQSARYQRLAWNLQKTCHINLSHTTRMSSFLRRDGRVM